MSLTLVCRYFKGSEQAQAVGEPLFVSFIGNNEVSSRVGKFGRYKQCLTMPNDAKQDYIFSTYKTKKSNGPLGQGNIVDLGLAS